jgi:hypothetical protein
MTRLIVFALLVPGILAQNKPEVEFKWSLAKDLASEYQVGELKGGKAVPMKDRSFLIYGGELLPDGTSALLVNSYEDLGPYFLFMLPRGGSRSGRSGRRT